VNKRQKFILSSVVLSIGLMFVQLAVFEWRYLAITLLSLLAAGFTLWSLREALGGIRYLTAIILPALFTAGVGLFYFLLPNTWLAVLPIALLYGFGFYALLLTENIFSVSAIRTIQLFRAAQAVGFLLTLLTAFFLYDTVFSFKLHAWTNAIFVFLISLPLYLQGLWSIDLEEKISRRLVAFSIVLTTVSAELSLIISFMPLTIAMSSLFLTTIVYVALGLSQAHFQGRLFRRTVNEYLAVGAIVLLVMILTINWG
jgi:hypothetical protein